MKRAAAIATLALSMFAPPTHGVECADFGEWLNLGCRRLVDTYANGKNELLLSGYSWHVPWTWTHERRQMENPNAWGGGWARTVDRPNGDADSVFFLIFRDSHRQAQYNVGYAWTTYWGEREKIQAGLGYTAINSALQQDLPLVLGVVLVGCVAVVIANLIVDILYAFIDPRVRYA